MSPSFQTELLIQRCVDDELSPADTRILLQQLDGIHNGWKCLACGLLEDRHLRRSLTADGPVPVAVAVGPTATTTISQLPAPQTLSSARLRHWWNHPLTSLSLCAAIAFVGGMLVSGPASRSVADAGRSAGTPALPPGTSGFTVQLPGTAGTGQVPVYEDFQELRRSAKNHPFFNGSDSRESMRVLVLPSADGRTIVVPLQNSGQTRLQ
jgi:hypothetical protein